MARETRCHLGVANVVPRHMDSLRLVLIATLRLATSTPSVFVSRPVAAFRLSSVVTSMFLVRDYPQPQTPLPLLFLFLFTLPTLSPVSKEKRDPSLQVLLSAMASLASATLQYRTVSVVSSAGCCRNDAAPKVSFVSFSGLLAGTSQRVSFVESRSIAAPRLRLVSCAAEGAEEAVAAPSKSAEPRNVTEIVRKVIASQLASPVEKVLPESKFSDLGADSLDTVEIMMALEEEFQISIDEDGAEKISTVKEAADLIEAELKRA